MNIPNNDDLPLPLGAVISAFSLLSECALYKRLYACSCSSDLNSEPL